MSLPATVHTLDIGYIEVSDVSALPSCKYVSLHTLDVGVTDVSNVPPASVHTLDEGAFTGPWLH
jgi:hypothetical protein